jgi:DNA-binding NtrC family response regulator
LHLHHAPTGEIYEAIEVSPVRDAHGAIAYFIEKLEEMLVSRSVDHDQGLIGCSPAFLQVLELITRVAPSDAVVLLQGESGTGKELVARAIHDASPRAYAPFVVLDCSGLPETLFESELFGHEKGAFTGATTRKAGLVEAAEGGTLFLDEVGDIPLSMQVKLLRLLETSTYRRVGSTDLRKANFRLVSATHRPLRRLASEGKFRQDLYFRLNIFPIALPALRERGDDLFHLTEYFLTELRVRYGQPEKYLHPSSIDWMRRYHWPGNIRELENLVHRQFLLSNDAAVFLIPDTANDASMSDTCQGELYGGFNEAKARAIECFERDYLTRVLNECQGNVSQAARVAGKERRALGKLIKKHGIDKTLYS